MKKTILKKAITVGTMAMLLSSCSTEPAKPKNEQNNMTEVKSEEKQIQTEEIEAYKNERREKIAANEKILADLKIRANMSKQEAKDSYNKSIAILEKRNNELKAKLESFQDKSAENWNAFKIEFNHDLQELGSAFDDFTKKNVK